MRELRQVVEDDVWLVRMMYQIILVVILCGIKRFERPDFSDDLLREGFSLI